MNLSPFPHSLSISSFSLHFLTLSPFPLPPSISSLSLHFLAARLQGYSKLCNPGTIWQFLGDISGTSWWRMGITVVIGRTRELLGDWILRIQLKLNTALLSTVRLEICQKIYTTGFRGKKFYTLKVRKLWWFLLKRNCVNALISVILVDFSLEFNWVCKILTVSVQNHKSCV